MPSLNQKRENLLNLALNSTVEEREKSEILNVGYSAATNRWEIIVKHHGDLKRVESDSIQVEELLAGYAIVTLPEAFIEAFTELPEVEYIEKPKSLIYDLYESKQSSCILPLTRGNNALSGRGVLVAVIDSGIDFFLPDFRVGEESRILYLWDQTLAPDEEKGWLPPEGFRVGVEFTREDINRALQTGSRAEASALVPERDISGHGTGVAAIAASSNADPLLRGVAPGSELIIVKLGTTEESGFPRTTELMRAIAYVLARAERENRPVAINLSFGNTYGPHDGSSLLERFLDNASEVGRTSICVGAGNEGSTGGHGAGNVKSPLEMELAVAERERTVNVQLWKSYEDNFTLRLRTPSGGEYHLPVGTQPNKSSFTTGRTKILFYVGMPTPYSNLQELFVVLLPETDYIEAGIWKFSLAPEKVSNGAVDFYLPSGIQRNTGTRFFQPDPNLTMTVPATAGRAISVAAYNDTLEAYADFSGRGVYREAGDYLTGNWRKPDLAAPGVGLLAARRGGGSESYTGTSFATPMVTGSAALLMEWGIIRGNDVFLYGEKMKAFLRKGAKPIRGEAVYPNNRIGWGVLCVEDSLPMELFYS